MYFLLSQVTVYLIFSFVVWDFKWMEKLSSADVETRIFVVTIWFVVTVISWIIIQTVLKD